MDHLIESRVDVEVSGGVDDGAGGALDGGVGQRPVEERRRLDHVRHPVDLRVCKKGRSVSAVSANTVVSPSLSR